MPAISYPELTEFDSKGRSGFIRTVGVEVSDLAPGNSIALLPVTSRGNPSEACRVMLHRDCIDRLISALQVIKQRQEAEKSRLAPLPDTR